MSIWQSYSIVERKTMLQQLAEKEGIPDYAVEKDWWVSAILRALFDLDCSNHLLFKGGTSLSKGWRLIERFSEDIDIAINHGFFSLSVENNNQIKNLRKKCRKYVANTLCGDLENRLRQMGIGGFEVCLQDSLEGVAVATDSDPTVVNINYESIVEHRSAYMPAAVKVEISCLSMDIPFEKVKIGSLIGEHFSDIDRDIDCIIPIVSPVRTFIEKAILLSEEFQKAQPRSLRMSRHLYDLEKLMDTDFGTKALTDTGLYRQIVEHRRKFYHVGAVDYDKDYPQSIAFVPPAEYLDKWRKDYSELIRSFVYGNSLSFELLLERMQQLQDRFRQLGGI